MTTTHEAVVENVSLLRDERGVAYVEGVILAWTAVSIAAAIMFVGGHYLAPRVQRIVDALYLGAP